MTKAKFIGAGEYEYKGWSISKDEFDSGTWWATKDGLSEDFLRLKDAKEWVDSQESADSEESDYDQSVVDKAVNMIRESSAERGEEFTNPSLVKKFTVLRLAREEREHFMVLFLDNRHRLIADEILFSGTIDAASVYPREVAKRALELNAAAVIFSHNHPSGLPEPSEADRRLTNRLVKGLDLLDIRSLDHIVVGGAETVSFAERGLM